MSETCFRNRGIDLETHFMDRVLIRGLLPFYSLSYEGGWFYIKSLSLFEVGFFIPISSPLFFILLSTMSSPSSSYVQVGLDNLERPLNRSPSPRAQVRGFDWSLIIVD